MKKINRLLLFAIVLLPNFLKAQSTETRNLPSFSNLKVGGSFETVIEQGNQETARIEAEGIDTKKILTEVKDQTLKLSLEKGEYRNIRIKVFITYKSLNSVSQSGSGKLTCNSDFEGDDFHVGASGSGGLVIKGKIKVKKVEIGVSGSGGANLNSVVAEELKMSVSGSGGLEISDGKVTNEEVAVAGSGGIKAFGLTSTNATVTVAGSGEVNITVDNSISGRIAGSGNINYKGNANIVSNSTAGSGRIRKV